VRHAQIVLHVARRMRYRTDHRQERKQANINVVAPRRAGVANMVRIRTPASCDTAREDARETVATIKN